MSINQHSYTIILFICITKEVVRLSKARLQVHGVLCIIQTSGRNTKLNCLFNISVISYLVPPYFRESISDESIPDESIHFAHK